MKDFKIIVVISIVLFSASLFLGRGVHPEIRSSNDYYQYIELGKNIFANLDFTVEGQLGELIAYPPLYPALLHLLTFFTKDPLVSIQWINYFSVSFLIIPLFFLTKSLFNKTIGVMVTALAVSLLSLLKPLNLPYYDYLFIFLTITVSWLTWEISSGQLKGTSFIILDGFLICLAYLTKALGISYCLLAIFSIYYFGKRGTNCQLPGRQKRIILLLVGFLPLFICYKALLFQGSKDKEVCNHGVRVFLIGNYAVNQTGQKEERLYELNQEGTEFNFLLKAKKTSIFLYSLQHPKFMAYKYKQGLKNMLYYLKATFVSASFRNWPKPLKNWLSIFLLALCLSAILAREFRPNVFYILFWILPSLGIPLILLLDRYLWPFIFFWLILFTAGGYNLLILSRRARFVTFLLVTVYVVCLLRYILLSIDYINYNQDKFPANQEYKQAALWLRSDARKAQQRIKIMARKTIFSYLADARFIALPYEVDWERIINFASLKKVDYIALDSKTLTILRPYSYSAALLETLPQSEKVRLVYQDRSQKGNNILIYKLKR